MGRWEEEEGEDDSLHTVYLQLYPELIAYPCLLYKTLGFWLKPKTFWSIKGLKFLKTFLRSLLNEPQLS